MLFVVFLLIGWCTSALVNPIPKPQSMSITGQPNVFMAFNISGDDQDGILADHFDEMVETLVKLQWFPVNGSFHESVFDVWAPLNPIETVSVDIKQKNVPLQYGVNETYVLKVKGDVKIESETVWGALNALKTLQQLVLYENGKFFIEGDVEIRDEPIYSHRGLLIDSGRNYLSKDSIKDQIDLMAFAKMNVLHWHLVDTQSWPVEMKSYPVMINDAYSFKEIYTQEDIKEIIKYAYRRGVRVVPELDLPGHSNRGWRLVDPEIVACANSPWTEVAVEPPGGQLDPSVDKMYEILEDVFDELNDLFTDNTFHVGHDELNPGCYNTSESILDWYDDNDGNFTDLLHYWVNKSIPIFTKNESTNLIMWQDIVSSEGVEVPKDVTLQVWLSSESVKDLTSKGYHVIVSSSEHFYLDCGFGGWVLNDTKSAGSWCDPYKSWQNIYSYDFTANLTKSEKELVRGAEVALWSEMVDSNSLISKVWSRAGAFAESVWSGNKGEDGEIRLLDVTPRMLNFREYVVALGYKVDALVPKFCQQHPGECNI